GAMSLDTEQLEWEAELAYQRSLVTRYRSYYVGTLFEDVDWDLAAKEAYTASPEKYQMPEKVSASHILINLDDRSEEEALALISSIVKQLESGADFGELAVQYSEDPSASKNSGNLGFFARGKMTPPFENVAFSLNEPGELSKPVKTRFGYHLIKLHEKHAATPTPFADVKEKLIENLQVKWADQAWQDKIIAIRSDVGIQKNEQALEELRRKHTPVIQ
ncbi:MAG: peptidylprolyl isomerase, partial [Pseudomonadales bacterium]